MAYSEHETIRALADAPAFKGLPAVELAKLVSAVEVRTYEAGATIVPTGARPDGLITLSSGVADLVVERADGSMARVVELGPGETFGEVALGGVDLGGAGLVARTPVVALLLPRSRYQALAQAHPAFGRRLSVTLGERLQARNRVIGEFSTALERLIARLLQVLTPEQRVAMRRSAVLETLPLDLARNLGGEPLISALGVLADSSGLVTREGDGYRLDPILRDHLRTELAALGASGEPEVAHQGAARVLEMSGDSRSALWHFASAGCWSDVQRLSETLDGTLDTKDPAELRTWLRSFPPGSLDRAPRLRALQDELSETPTGTAARPQRRARLSPKHRWGVSLAIVLFLLTALPNPPAGLSREGQLALALLAASVPLMVFEVLADHLVALFMVVGWAALGLVPGRVALSGYSSNTWFVVLAILGIGVGIGKTGLLYRAVLNLANRAPRSLTAQALTLAAAGLAFTPSMPNATSRMVLSAPVGLEMIDAFGLPRRGPSSVIVGIATLLGFGVMGTLFLTGTSSGLLVHSVLPAEVQQQFSFLPWFLAALPLHAVIFAVTFTAAVWLYREGATVPVRNELLRAQSVALGKPTFAEWLSGTVMVLLILGLVTEPWHKVNAAWIASAGLLVLGALGIVDANSFRSGINWSFLIFFGAITSLGDVLTTLKVDAWIGESMSKLLAPLAGVPTLFLVGLALAGMASCFAIRWQAASVLLTIVMAPTAAAIGINPWIVGIIALTACNLWVFPYQSTIYLALYSGIDGQLFRHDQVRVLGVIYAAAVLAGVIISVPWWRAMGLMP